MRVAKFSYIALTLLIVSMVSFRCAQAQVPVTDTPGIKQNIKNTMQSIKESKTVTDAVAFAKKTSTAIGDAKKSVTEYVIKNKEKVEKKLEKAREYKERAEKYKKEYDDYKKLYEEKKAEIESVKAQVEDGVATAKGAAEAAKGMAGGVQDMAQSKIDGVKDKAGVGNPSGSDASGGSDVPEVATSGAVNTGVVGRGVDDAVNLTIPDAQNPAVDSANVAPVEADVNTVEELPLAVSARQPFTKDNMLPVKSETPKQAEPALVNADVKAVPPSISASQDVLAPRATNKTNGAISKAVSGKALTIQPAAKASEVELNKLKKTPLPQNKMPTRRGFKALERQSNRTDFNGFAFVSQTSPLAFASILGISDGGVNEDGDMIIPSALAMSCNISSADALKKGVLDACMVRINDMQKGSQLEQPENGAAIYRKGLRVYAAAYIAEAVKAKNDTEAFVAKVVDPVDFANTTTETDDYANIGEMHKAVVTTINGLLKVHSSELAMNIYQNYGNYKFSSPEEDVN